MKLFFVALLICSYLCLRKAKTTSVIGNTNRNVTTATNTDSITPESGRSTHPRGLMTPETGSTTSPGGLMTPEKGSTTSPAGSMTPEKGSTTSSGGLMTPEKGRTTSLGGSISPESRPTSPTEETTSQVGNQNILTDNTQQEIAELWNSMPLNSRQWKITLLVFSGLADPEWVVASTNRKINKEIEKLFSIAVKLNKIYEPERVHSKLGFKGFLLQAGKEGPGFFILGDETKELQNVLLRSMPERLISNDLLDRILKEITQGGSLPAKMVVDGELAKRQPPRGYGYWTQFLWNNFFIKPRNNCYNYAIDRFTLSMAHPGLANGIHLSRPLDGNLVMNGAIADGLRLPTQNQIPPQGFAGIQLNPNEHLVALVVYDDDYHWYRLDRDGRWTHKPGSTSVTNLDNDDNIITDPRVSNNGLYLFQRFMIVNKNIVTIRGY